MDISTAIKHAIDGNAMLFTGSGFSFGAVPLEGKTFLTGRELAKRLYEECGIAPPDDDLYYASKRYLKANQPKDLVLLLEKLFTVREVGDLHKRFSEIRWKSVFTTNYDDVLETAFKAKGKSCIRLLLIKIQILSHHAITAVFI